MNRVLVALLVALLGGCKLAATMGDSPQAQCQRQSYEDPAVQAAIQASNGDYTVDDTNVRYLRQQALLRCLRQKGLAPPGGVEPLRPTMNPIPLPFP
jgi:hypothetical protein